MGESKRHRIETVGHDVHLVAVDVTNDSKFPIYSALNKPHLSSSWKERAFLDVFLYDAIFTPVSMCPLYLYASASHMLLFVTRVCEYALQFPSSLVPASQGPRQWAKPSDVRTNSPIHVLLHRMRVLIVNMNHFDTTSSPHAHSQSPNRSGIARGASRLHPYSTMQIQLDTTRIHIAISDRPI